ncbi:MAG: oligosaccharide flippase family protein [Bacteroidia bacterium]
MKGIARKTVHSIKSKFDHESKTLFKNSSWVFSANLVGSILGFLRSILIARLLGVELLGTYTVSIAFVLTTQEFMRLNVSMGLIRYGARYLQEKSHEKLIAVVKYSLLLSVLSALASILLLILLTLLFYNTFIPMEGLGVYVILFAIANSLSFVDAISKAILKLFYKFKTNSMIQMIMDTIEFTLVALTLFYFRGDLSKFMTAVIITRIVNSLVCNYAAWNELRPEISPWWNKGHIPLMRSDRKEFLQFIFGNSISSSIKVLMNQGDIILLGQISGVRAVGLYANAKKLAYSVLTITDPLVNAIFPQFSVLVAKKEYHKVKTMLRKLSLLTLGPAFLFMVITYFFREEIITALYGKEYADAGMPFFYLMITGIQASVFFWALPLIQSLGLTRLRLSSYIAGVILGGIVAWWLSPIMGPTGTAIGVLIANVFINILFIRAGIKGLNV